MPFTRQLLLLQVGVILGLGILSLVAVTWMLRSSLSNQYEQRALGVARAVAADQGLGDLVRARDQPAVARAAAAQERATGALFVVVTDDQGVRLAHPNPDRIGEKVSTDPRDALSGHEVTDIERGTLGLSARGKVPLRDSAGGIVGEVSVGFPASEIDASLSGLLLVAIPCGLLAVALGAALSGRLARRLKRVTLGLEPAEFADLVREREAVLYGIGEGVLAVDPAGRVTMCNAEARRLLGQDISRGMALADVPLPDRLRAAFDGHENAVIAVTGDRVLVGKHRPVTLDGADLGGVLTIRDRTDLESLTDELAAVRSMTTALRAQRHEFANRMHTVLGLLQTGSVDDAVEYLDSASARSAATRMSDTPSVQSNTIRALMAAKTAQAAERGVTLELSEESWLPQRLVAPVEVVTVLGNLVDNALDAAASSTVRPARVVVDLLADGTTLVISVANSGDGIDADLAESFFVEGVSTRGAHRGLGLAICRQAARGLGGDVLLRAGGGGGEQTVFVATMPEVLSAEAEPVLGSAGAPDAGPGAEVEVP